MAVWEINGASPDTTNSFEHLYAISLTQRSRRDAHSLELAPHSASTIAFAVR